MNTRTGRIVFDVPVVLLELLYWREARDLDVAPDMPAAAPVVEHAPAPDGAADRWRQAYASLVDQFEHDDLKPGWFALDGGGDRPAHGLPALARAWVNEQRLRVIDALTSSKQNGPRVYRRGQSLFGGPITHVLVLPVVGHYSARPTTRVLVTSLDTFLDDAAWATAIAS